MKGGCWTGYVNSIKKFRLCLRGGTAFESWVLLDVNVTIPQHQYTAIIGQTGSGKSTLVKHLNGLLLPAAGEVWVDNFKVVPGMKQKDVAPLRKKVGMVFQFPEAQLFEETVLKDVMFGPMNMGASEEEAKVVAKHALSQCGVPVGLHERSPFDLSGGQMRRVAIAGILAMEPEILILDEPTAGLDPMGREQMMAMFYRLYKEEGLTVILVTHQMNDVVAYADHVVVMAKGTCVKEGSPKEIFADETWLKEQQLDVPDTLHFVRAFNKRMKRPLGDDILTLEELAAALTTWQKEGEHEG